MKWLRYKRLWYWAAQVLLWSLFAVSQASVYLTVHNPLPGPAELARAGAWISGQALAGLLLTHGARWLLLRARVPTAGLGRQLLALALGKVLLSLSYYAVVFGLGHVLTRPSERFVAPSPPRPVASSAAPRERAPAGFMDGLRQGLTGQDSDLAAEAYPLHLSLDAQLGRSQWSHYTFVWLLGYLFIVAAERRLGAELEQARAEADLSRTQLELLHQQINPHFLFNTLNSIRALALIDPHRTRTALTQLADLLRYSLRPPGSGQLISLGEELTAVRDYLALEQTRFGPERLRLAVDVPEALLAWPVPPAALLTLVENAVKHGLAATPQGGTLGLHAAQQGAGLTLTVRQPGHLPAPGGQAAGTGLGLANTRQRLRALYGAAAGLALAEGPVGTVTATLRLPAAPLAA